MRPIFLVIWFLISEWCTSLFQHVRLLDDANLVIAYLRLAYDFSKLMIVWLPAMKSS